MLRFNIGEPVVNVQLQSFMQQDVIESENQSTPTPENILSTLERVHVDENDERQCSICFDNLSGTCINLRCNHLFHEQCITRWLQRHSSCPVCRNDVYDIIQSTPVQNSEVNILQNITPPTIINSSQRKNIHFIFTNGTQVDTIWNTSTKAYELLLFLKQFTVIQNVNYKVKFNIGNITFGFSMNDSFRTLNTTLQELMIQNHCIMRVTEES